MNKLIKYIIILILFQNVFGQEQEYILKSAFIEKFCRFTDWDVEKMDSSQYFNIALVGDHQFDHLFENMFKNLTLKNKKVKIHHVTNINQLASSPHLIFISPDQTKYLNDILEYAKNNNILTIADTKGFGEKGVHINFYLTDKETLHFTINLKTLEAAQLRISLMLIEIAKVI